MEEEKSDLISSLPEETIRRIVSFLPLKHAVRTSILSTLWRGLWMPTHISLNFDIDQITSREASKDVTQLVVDTFLTSHGGRWKLGLGFPKSEKEPSKMEDKWILLATKTARELYLDFFKDQHMTNGFNLKFEINCLNLDNHPMETSSFDSLKILHLRSVTHIAKDIVQALFSKCQLLETLKLVKCSGLQCLDIKANNSFESFEMVDCPNLASLILSAPNLKSFRYRGVLPYIQIRNTSHLVDATLDFKDGPGLNEFDCEELISLLAVLKDVEILTLSGWLLAWLCSAGVIFGHLEFKFNKLKELWWIGSSIDRAKRDSIACFLNISPFLENLFIDIDPQLNSFPCPVFHHYWHEPHLWLDHETVKSNALPLKHLEIVMISGFTHQEDELMLMDVLLKKAVTFTSMTVKSRQNHSWRVVKIPAGSQLKQTTRSQWKKIPFSSQENEYFYGYIEEDCSDLSPTHGQMCC